MLGCCSTTRTVQALAILSPVTLEKRVAFEPMGGLACAGPYCAIKCVSTPSIQSRMDLHRSVWKAALRLVREVACRLLWRSEQTASLEPKVGFGLITSILLVGARRKSGASCARWLTSDARSLVFRRSTREHFQDRVLEWRADQQALQLHRISSATVMGSCLCLAARASVLSSIEASIQPT